MYTNIKSSCCTPKPYAISFANYTSVKLGEERQPAHRVKEFAQDYTIFKWKIQDSNLFEYHTPLLLKKCIWLLLLLLLFSHSAMSNSLQTHGQWHPRLPCPSPSPRVCSNLCPLSRWYNHLILCCPLLLLPSVFPSIRVLYLLPIIYSFLAFSSNTTLY